MQIPSYLQPEVKYHDMDLGSRQLTNGIQPIGPGDWIDSTGGGSGFICADSRVLYTNIMQGTSESTRIGRKIKVLSMDFTFRLDVDYGSINQHAWIDDTECEMYIVYDSQSNNTISGAADTEIWNTAMGARPNGLYRNLNEQSRFRILKKKTIHFGRNVRDTVYGTGTPSGVFTASRFFKQYRVFCKPNKLVHYNVEDQIVGPGVLDGTRLPGGNIQIWFVWNHGSTTTTHPRVTIENARLRTKFIDV